MAVAIAGYVERTTVIPNGETWEEVFICRQDAALGSVRLATIFDGFVHAEGQAVDWDLSVAESASGTWRIFLAGTEGPTLTTAAGTPLQGIRIPGLFLRFRVANNSGGALTSFRGFGVASVL